MTTTDASFSPRSLEEHVHDKRQPSATIVGWDANDRHSGLNAPDACRAPFGPEPAWTPNGPVDTGHDFTQADAYLREAHEKAKRHHERRRWAASTV